MSHSTHRVKSKGWADMSAAQKHMDSLSAVERGQRRGCALTMLQLARELYPDRNVDAVNEDYIAFTNVKLLEGWIAIAKQIIATKRQARAAEDEPIAASAGDKRKA